MKSILVIQTSTLCLQVNKYNIIVVMKLVQNYFVNVHIIYT